VSKALIIGGTSGIGAAIAELMSNSNIDVSAVGRKEFDIQTFDYATDLSQRVSVSNSTPEKDTNGAHCDLSRNYTLLYLLDSGGEDHQTVFYQEQDKPIQRSNGERCPDHSRLTIIDSIKVPLRKWVLLNATILHGVINIPKPRISIQVGLNSVVGLGLVD
jgi:NAD(P)-dependent dehydrogenase (short-subunit alcohol dehydrogenase family)